MQSVDVSRSAERRLAVVAGQLPREVLVRLLERRRDHPQVHADDEHAGRVTDCAEHIHSFDDVHNLVRRAAVEVLNEHYAGSSSTRST